MAGTITPIYHCETLYLSREFAPRFAPALQELVGERATEVLPALRSLFLELHPSRPGPQESIESSLPRDGSLVTL